MAHKPTRRGRVPTGTSLDPFAIHHSIAHEQPKRAHQAESQVDGYTSDTTRSTEQRGASGGGAARTPSGDDEDDADVSDTDVTDADEEDNDDEDGDALAPSDRAMEGHGDQAGPINAYGDHTARLLEEADVVSLDSGAPDFKRSRNPEYNVESQNADCDSDDEVYNRVNLISDAEEGESDIEKSEENDIIQSREGDDISSKPATAPTSTTKASDNWAGFDLDDDLFSTNISHFDEQFGSNEPSILESEIQIFFRSNALYEGLDPLPSLPASPTPTPTPRQVRFKESILTRDDDSDIVSDDEDLNGLFNSAAAMPSKGRASDSQVVGNEGDDESVGNSSGYETDYGETTDEEDVPASATTRPERLMRQPSVSLDIYSQVSSSAAPGPFKVPTTPVTPRRGPRMGSWVADPTKPFAMIDCTGDNMVIVPAKRPARAIDPLTRLDNCIVSTANTSPIASQPTWAMDDSEVDFTDFSAFGPNPTLASEPDVMPSTLLPTAPSSQVQDQTFPPSLVFVPIDDIRDFNSMFPVDNQRIDEDDDEDLLKVEDFIDFGISSEDEGGEELGFAETTTLPTPASTSPSGIDARCQSQTAASPAYDLVKHLDKGLVGSFRRSQPYHQAHLRRPQGGVLLNSHAFRGGKLPAGHSSLIIQKKRKLSDTFGGCPALDKRRISNRR